MATPGLSSTSGRSNGGPRLVHSAGELPTMAGSAQVREPFATDTTGFDYFRTDFHHRYLVAAIREHLTRARGFVLVTGEPGADSDLLARFLTDDKEAGYRVALVRCGPGMVFDDLVRAYSRQLGLRADDDSGRLWALLSHLMLESRNGVTRILIVDNADALDIRTFDELHRFAKLDDPHLMSVVLLSSPSFAQRLDAAPLNFLKPAIVGQVAVQRLLPEEVAAFIHYQLNATPGAESALSAQTIAAIAETAKGDPVVVNRLARRAMPSRPPPAPAPELPPAAAAAPAPAAPSSPASAPAAKAPEPAPVPPPPAAPPRVLRPSPPAPAASPPAPAVGASLSPASIDTGDEDPIPDTPLVLPAVLPATAERQEPVAAQQLRAVASGKSPAGQALVALAEAERAGADKAEKKAPAPKARAPAGEGDDTTPVPLVAPPPMLPRVRRRQMASGVAAVIYLLAVVLSGAALLYLFDPGVPREPAPLSAAATIPPPETVPADSSQPAAPSVTPAVPAETASSPVPAQSPPASSGETPPDVPSATAQSGAVTAPSVPPTADASAPAVRSPVPAEAPAAAPPPSAPPAAAPSPSAPPVAEARPALVAPAPAPPPASAQANPVPPIPAPAKDERPNEAEARNAAKVEPAAAAPEPSAGASPPARTAPAATASNDQAPGTAPAAAPSASTGGSVAALEPQAQAVPEQRSDAVQKPSEQDVAMLVHRADELLAEGDIVSARRFFERAAEGGDAAAACGIAKSYDPLFLRQTGVRGVAGDPGKAAKWYRSAAAAGSSEASIRLKRLELAYPPR